MAMPSLPTSSATSASIQIGTDAGGNLRDEDEVIVGTILAPARDSRLRRQRKEQTSQMREQASILVDYFESAMLQGIERGVEAGLRRAWLSFRLTTICRDAFGCKSFRLIALHAIFDGIKLKENLI